MGLYLFVCNPLWAQKKVKAQSPVALGQNGRLVYAPDSVGNRIIDFSYSGYTAGNDPIPDIPAKIFVPVKTGDATLRIQSALDYVASLPTDRNGFKGAVLLEKGIHTVKGTLHINASGVVLRGSGAQADGTVLFAEGNTRETVIRILGKNDLKTQDDIKIADSYVPVNAMQFRVAKHGKLTAGDCVMIKRPATKAWLTHLKMEEFGGETAWLGWKPGQHDLTWDRTVTAVTGDLITIDAPLTTALESRLGDATVSVYAWPGRINHSGVENLVIESEFDETNLKDEDHRWMGVTFDNIENGWVRQVNFRNLAGSAVAIYETGSKITVEDCKSLHPVSEIGGQRRYTFFTQGQQTLFQRCYSEYGYHDFSVGFCAPGPNAFVQCEARLPFCFSGAIDSWASGVLFDGVNMDGNALSLKNRGQDGHGAGWTVANSVLWQCSASKVENFSPPGAANYAFGIWSQFAGDGYWENVNEHVKPTSLYYAQLADRLGEQVLKRSSLIPRETEASSSPSIEQAAALAAGSLKPALQLAEWIDLARQRNPIPVSSQGLKSVDDMGINQIEVLKTLAPLTLKNGWLVRGDQVVTGGRQEVSWWRGSLRREDLKSAKPHITRFVPGRYGNGLTDIPSQTADLLLKKNITVLDHNYGLWYDRRRDDHERTRRIDGEVWAPFYEQPFARSGQGAAWDNLSKYDLTKYNTWYWDRLKQFADLADQKGLILYHQNYFQHNILEAGAHYADFPWRPANNINDTGFPEPPPYAGDKRIFMADQFYDIENPTRKALHKAYIRKCLDNFAGNSGVVQFVSAEYTGPLHFVKFWLDVISEWEQENKKNTLVALSTTKDVQDAILADPAYAPIVDIIDIRYWYGTEGGSVYAPAGGKNLAPRQHARIQKAGKISFESVYQSVLEYRNKYPDKAVIYSANGAENLAWAVFMAGGSVSAVPKVSVKGFLEEVTGMRPITLQTRAKGQYTLGDQATGMILYQEASESVKLDLTNYKGTFVLRKINPTTGIVSDKKEKIKGGNLLTLAISPDSPLILWISKK